MLYWPCLWGYNPRANLKRGGERKTERADRQTLECVAKLSHPLPADRKEGGFLLGETLPARASVESAEQTPSRLVKPVAQHLNNRRCDRSQDAKEDSYLFGDSPRIWITSWRAGEAVVEETLTVYGLLEDLNEEFDPGSG